MEYIKEVCQSCRTDTPKSSGQSSVSLLLSPFWIHFGGIQRIGYTMGIPWYTQFAESQHPAADSCRKQALMKSPLPEEKLLRRLTRTASSKKNKDSSLNSAKICMLIDDIWWSLMIVDAFLQTFYCIYFSLHPSARMNGIADSKRLALVSPWFRLCFPAMWCDGQVQDKLDELQEKYDSETERLAHESHVCFPSSVHIVHHTGDY